MTHQKRIAICISGQVRTASEKLKEIAKQAEAVNADVFISVWEERGGKTFESGPRHLSILRVFGGKMAMFFPKTWCYGFETEFPDWRIIMPDRPSVTHSEIQEIFPEAVVEIEADRPELDLPAEKNSLRMLYKIFRCNQLKKEHEKAQDFTYDRVIRVRPDMLVDFQRLITPDLQKNELLASLRRGHSLHDKYWAGSSDTDNIMADLYEYATENRISSWKGIHQELTDYVAARGIIPIGAPSTLSDFREFGKYTEEEQCGIIKRFKKLLENNAETEKKESDPAFRALAKMVFTQASEYICAPTPKRPDPALAAQMESCLSADEPTENARLLLPIVSLAFACDQRASPEDRAKLAFCVLMDDALTWKPWLGFRARHIVEILPECGAELVPLIAEPNQSTLFSSGSDVIQPLLSLWAQQVAAFNTAAIHEAQEAMFRSFLNDQKVRAAVYNFLKEEGRFKELLAFANLVFDLNPAQKNAKVFLSHVERLIAK